MYDWLGVDKVELAVMTELLLRGAQTEGELRGRAARMDPIPDLAALRPILESLTRKGLILSLSAPGRGHVVTHALYEPRELDKLRAEHGEVQTAPTYAAPPAPPRAAPAAVTPPAPNPAPTAATPAHVPQSAGSAPPVPAPVRNDLPAATSPLIGIIGELRDEVNELREQVARLRREMDELLAQLS